MGRMTAKADEPKFAESRRTAAQPQTTDCHDVEGWTVLVGRFQAKPLALPRSIAFPLRCLFHGHYAPVDARAMSGKGNLHGAIRLQARPERRAGAKWRAGHRIGR